MPVEVARVYLVFPHDRIFIGPLYPADTHTHIKSRTYYFKKKEKCLFYVGGKQRDQTIKIVELVSLKS